MRPGRSGKRGVWFQDFVIADGRVRLRKSGVGLPLNLTLVVDALKWFGWFLTVHAVAARRPADGPALHFAPDQPRPWYVIWAAMKLAGLRVAASPEAADARVRFEDLTSATAMPAPSPRRVLNGACQDISKSAVAAAFETAFGYALAVDPAAWAGPAVEKSETNGVHDGRIVHCPTAPRPDCAYSRLIDTAEAGVLIDLRTACVGGRPVVVYRKRKAPNNRFGIDNLSVELLEPGAVFTNDEIAALARFCAAMRLDWAALDVLRDRADGRLYVVDANPTDMGPPIALPTRDKLAACRALGQALRAMLIVPATET